MNYQLCDTPAALDHFLERAQDSSRIALDFEGESNLHRYGIHLCLCQVALDSGDIFLFDPMTLGESFLRLGPLLSDSKALKVMFSPDFDVRLLHHATGIELTGIFDLQLAAKWIGFEKTGLDAILSRLGLIDDGLSKGDQTSDWTRRPLSTHQLDYAAGDVLHLLAAYDVIEPQLTETGRGDEFQREMVKLESLRFQTGTLSHGFKKKLRSLPRHLVDLAETLYWEREKIAEGLDIPPFKVLSNDLLVYLAKTRPVGDGAWSRVKGLNPRARSRLKPLAEAIEGFVHQRN